MANEDKNLKIIDYEDKKGKESGKRYTRFQTNEGWFSAFEKEVIDPLKELEGKWAKVTVAITDNFKNIRAFQGEAEPEGDEEQEKLENTKPEKLQTSSKAKIINMRDKDKEIIAQCLTKCVTEIWSAKVKAGAEINTEPINAVVDAYERILKKLEG